MAVIAEVVVGHRVGLAGQPVLQHLMDPLDHRGVLVHRQTLQRLERPHRLVDLGVSAAAVVRQFLHDDNASTAAWAHG